MKTVHALSSVFAALVVAGCAVTSGADSDQDLSCDEAFASLVTCADAPDQPQCAEDSLAAERLTEDDCASSGDGKADVFGMGNPAGGKCWPLPYQPDAMCAPGAFCMLNVCRDANDWKASECYGPNGMRYESAEIAEALSGRCCDYLSSASLVTYSLCCSWSDPDDCLLAKTDRVSGRVYAVVSTSRE
ncbi:MAG: hypothetical protein JRI23_16455 [Deltaproteobacteria bacterium]|nr:hypothetical protein [Deltaproteobacteria bacterium]MBW2533368.1 hypothetical protein [Deltaproteobacteria bacterium]